MGNGEKQGHRHKSRALSKQNVKTLKNLGTESKIRSCTGKSKLTD